MKIIKTLILIIAMTSLAIASNKLGDHSDGSQGTSSHSYLFRLYDYQGLTIDPFKGSEPFSTKETCGRCHDYAGISMGLHFNAGQSQDDGRTGEPWILVDPQTATQLPMSYRSWKGAVRPDNLMIPPAFVAQFGGFSPGNMYFDEDFDTGKPLYNDINCLSCHNGDAVQSHMKYNMQMRESMFSAAITASSNMAHITGDMFDPQAQYNSNYFDKRGMVRLNMTRHIPNENCLNCHSNAHSDQTGRNRWTIDADIHIKSGMSCVDCHRNGLNHAMVRGYAGEKQGINNIEAGTLSCAGCHLGKITKDTENPIEIDRPIAGRFGAPYPKHPGIPPIHFEKMSCTACHSGDWPGQQAGLLKTSRGHLLGMLDSKIYPEALPHIYGPVLTEGYDGKIAPHKMIWPAFWAWQNDQGELTAISPDEISVKFTSPADGNWPKLTEDDIAQTLARLQARPFQGQKPVYIAHGQLHSLSNEKLVASDHESAEPYKWAIGHNVRPASQAMGVGGDCSHCHSTKAGFFFGQVPVDGPMQANSITMADMQASIDGSFMKKFNFSFVFRPIMKYFSLLLTAVLIVILATYIFKAAAFVFAIFSGKIPQAATEKEYELMSTYVWWRKWTYAIIWALLGILAITGFSGWIAGHFTGWALMIHCTAAPIFLAFLTLAAIFWAADNRFVRRDIFALHSGALKLCFWAVLALAVIVTLSAVLCMFPLFGTSWQIGLLWTHRIASILLTLFALAHLYLLWVAKTHKIDYKTT